MFFQTIYAVGFLKEHKNYFKKNNNFYFINMKWLIMKEDISSLEYFLNFWSCSV